MPCAFRSYAARRELKREKLLQKYESYKRLVSLADPCDKRACVLTLPDLVVQRQREDARQVRAVEAQRVQLLRPRQPVAAADGAAGRR